MMPLLLAVEDSEIGLAAIMTAATFLVVWVIAHYRVRVRVAAYNARLKQLMIERGMSAEEIERVLAAEGKPKGRDLKHHKHI